LAVINLSESRCAVVEWTVISKWIVNVATVASVFFLHLVSAPCMAQTRLYPTKPVRIVTGSAGTSGDLLSRFLAQYLIEHWAKPVIVDNRTGGGVVAAEMVARANHDGYTLHMAQQSSFAVAVSLYAHLPYDPLRDFTPITLVAHIPQLLIANASLPFHDVKGMLDYVRQRPGQINYSSGGVTTTGNLSFELLKSMAGLKMVHVPYKGVFLATTAVSSGEVQLSMVPVTVALAQITTGKIKALAISSKVRFKANAEIPTLAESGLAGFEATTWFGIAGPAQLPASLVSEVSRQCNAWLAQSSSRDWFDKQGAQQAGGSPNDFKIFMKNEITKWSRLIHAAGIKAE